MAPKIVDLRSNRHLLHPDFDGYKLSLHVVPVEKLQLPSAVDRALPDTGETVNDLTYVYFVDKNWVIQKVYVKPFTNGLCTLPVWQIPNKCERQLGDYGVTLRLTSQETAVLSDGTGMLFVLHTGNRCENGTWDLLHCEYVFGERKPFSIRDSCYREAHNKKELHLLLLRIAQEKPDEVFQHFVSWITLTTDEKGKWGITALRQLKGKGEMYYCAFEFGCEALYIASDNGFSFTADSENPILSEVLESEVKKVKKYVWSQTSEDIQLKLNLPENFVKNKIKVDSKSNEISICYKEEILLSGKLYQRVDNNLTTWTVTNKVIEISLTKQEVGLVWPELIEGDDDGEFVADPSFVEEIHQRLRHLTSETEATPHTGTTLNSQQVEECDFTDDKSSTLERICCKTHNVSHRIYLGTHPILMSTTLFSNLPPALGLRHDVDVLLWQPYGLENEEWKIKHEGTLLAFGYVQASKQQKKFLTCTPDMNHAIVCESNRHIFIYSQNKPVTSGILKNRTSGQRINTVAEQRVITIDNEDILGYYVSNVELCILTENTVLYYKL